MINIVNLSKSFGKKKVIENLSLKVEKGEHVAIMSPSGSGKTTLLRIISGLDKKYGGTCEVNGKISYVFQENRLFPNSTVMENVLALNPDKERAKELLAKVELQDSLNEYPEKLSGGMKRRLALARALAFDFDILLLDEAFNGVDEELKIRIAERLEKELENKTLVLVTHNEDEIKLLNCKKIHFN